MTASPPNLEPLRSDHADAVLAFEIANRAYFAGSINDRGDEYFARFAQEHAARLTEQDAGLGAYYVLVDPDGTVLGRVNLIFADDATARLGYRMAQAAAGRGLATSAVREVCELAAHRRGLTRLVAVTSRANIASQRVLIKSGFVLVGAADPADVGGKAGLQFEKQLI